MPVRAVAAAVVAALALGHPTQASAITHPDGTGRVPWEALVTAELSKRKALRCGGTVRDALHVITAAHCTYDRAGRPLPAGAISVVAGITSALSPEASAQQRAVAAVSSDPAYALDGGTAVHDAAVLTLDEPLDLGAPAIVRPLSLAGAGATARAGEFSGWGRTASHRPGGALHFATLEVLPSRACARFGVRFAAATMLCAGRRNADGTATGGCNGDSGSALVRRGRLVGIASFTGPRSCGDRRYPTVFVRVGDPGVNAFLRQRDPPPRPASLAAASVAGAATAGGAVRCRPGRWTGAASLSYAFARVPVLDGTAGGAGALAVAPPSRADVYRPLGGELASALVCVVRAANRGGAVTVTSANAVGAAGSVPVR